jgi:MFS family permease
LATPLIALMMSITVISGAITQLPAGRISDKTDRRYVIVTLALGAALVGAAIVALKPDEAFFILFLTGLYGALHYPLYGLAVAHANDFADASDFVAVSGGLLLLYGAGTMLGPLAGSAAMTALGPEAVFVVTAVSHALIAGWAFYRTYKRAPIPESVRESFKNVPAQTTPATAALDPRAEDQTILDRDVVAVK